MSWKCKHCTKQQTRIVKGIRVVYCNCNKFFPNPNYINAYGCDQYEDIQLKLFGENKL